MYKELIGRKIVINCSFATTSSNCASNVNYYGTLLNYDNGILKVQVDESGYVLDLPQPSVGKIFGSIMQQDNTIKQDLVMYFNEKWIIYVGCMD